MPRGDHRLRAADGAYNMIYDRARTRRSTLKITQDSLCARLAAVTGGEWNPDRRDIYKIERGTRTVSDTEVLALARALECDPVWLFLGKSVEPDAPAS